MSDAERCQARVDPGRTMSPEQSVLCSVSSHFAERDIVRPGATSSLSSIAESRVPNRMRDSAP